LKHSEMELGPFEKITFFPPDPLILPYGLCFAEYTFIPYKYFLANFVIIINPAIVFTVSVMIS
jgi:hypothetical protein